MRIFLPIIFGILIGSFLVANLVLGLDVGLEYGTYTGLGTEDLRVSMMRIVRAALAFLGVLAIAIIVYGGFIWMTAGGNVERIDKAKKILRNAVIGLVIILLAFAIASFIINQLLEATGFREPCEPEGATEYCDYVWPGCPGERICEASGFWSGCSPTDLSDPDCDPSAIRECRVKRITPTSPPDQPMNSVVKVRFNHGNVTNINDIVVTNTGTGLPVDVNRNVIGSLVELTPQVFCNPPWQTLNCFAANTTYEVTVNPGSIQCGGYNLVCGGVGADPCLATFTTGDFIDTEVPIINIVPAQICQAERNDLKALVDDDYGIAYVDFKDTTTPTDIGTDDNVSVPGFVVVNWDTSGYGVNANITVEAEAVDYNAFSTTDDENFTIRAGHCCNNIQDEDEEDVNCGGADCEPCAPIIEWVWPLDGAPGNMITIHGRHFGTAEGQVYFADAGGEPAVLASLASSANSACTEVWNNNEIIVLAPPTAQDGPIGVTRTDGLYNQTSYNFDINSITRPGLCGIFPLTCVDGDNHGTRCDNDSDCDSNNCSGPPAGETNDNERLEGLNFVSGASQVYFSEVLAGGTANVTLGKTITGVTVPAMEEAEINVWVEVNEEYSNPKTFQIGLIGEQKVLECTSDIPPVTCTVDQNKCQPDEYCSNECVCVPATPCDSNLNTPACDPGICDPGYYCYSSAIHPIDPNKSDCHCYPATPCDEDTNTPACDVVDNDICPDDYFCDPVSNCTCQPAVVGMATDSSYTWTFQTGIQPGPCSQNEGMCVADDTLCGIDEICHPVTCNCEIIPEAECTVGDAAVCFDDFDSYVQIADDDSLDITDEITVEAWIKTTGSTFPDQPMIILRKTFAYEIVVDHFGQAAILVGNGNDWSGDDFVRGTTDVTDDQWHHIVGVHSASEGWSKIYVDGQEEGSNNVEFKLTGTNDRDLYISHTDWVSPVQDKRFFNGTIDDVAIYDRVLTPPEILYLSLDRRVAQDSLISFWRLNNNIDDEKGINNGTWASDSTYCTGHFPCEELIPCDANTATPACESEQTMCPIGYYCYDPDIHGEDSSRQPCFCYPGIYCDGDIDTPACDPDDDMCPTDYLCDPDSNCTCQPEEVGMPTDSTYTWTFQTTSFGPRVVEDCDRTPECDSSTITSPTPFSRAGTDSAGYQVNSRRRDDGAVPIDAIIGARFTERMYVSSLVDPNPSTTHPNVTLYDCSEATGDFSDSGCTTEVPGVVTVNECNYQDPVVYDAHCFKLIPNNLLSVNHWYLVVLNTADIYGENGVNLVSNDPLSGDYKWVFKTRESLDLSQVDCLYLEPRAATLHQYDQRQKYGAYPQPVDFHCVDVRPEACSLDGGTTEAYQWSIGSTHGDPTAAIIVQLGDPKPDPIYDSVATDHLASAAARKETIPDWVSVDAICQTPAGNVPGSSNLTIDFSSPYVIDRFPDCGTACLNAKIGATFSKEMDNAGPAAVSANLKLYVCYDDPTCDLNLADEITTFSASLDPAEAANTFTGYVPCYDFDGDGNFDYCLLPNTYYRLVIDGQVRSVREHISLAGLNFDTNPDDEIDQDSYSWVFKTQEDYGMCLPSRIDVIPAEKRADYNQTIFYSSRPWTAPDICDPDFGQRLNPYSYNWNWQSTEPTVADLLTPLRDSCGNGRVEAGEDCDDGNIVSEDGCSDICLNEGSTTCGNGQIEIGEECEPPAAYCDPSSCLWTGNNDYDKEVCGNRIVESTEECDPPSPGCASNCLLTGSVLGYSVCGDGQVGVGEECDTAERLTGRAPANDDHGGCSANCLIENRILSFCRSKITNKFVFGRLPANYTCSGSSECIDSYGPDYECVQLDTITGNTNTGSVCGNGIVEAGEECDTGDEPDDDNSDGCSNICFRSGSVQEVIDPPDVGAYQIVQTFEVDGETYIQSWLANYTPAAAGPLGQGHLTVGAGTLEPGKFGIIDRWPDCASACINASIGGQFNASANTDTIKISNIFLYDCGTDNNCDLNDKNALPITVLTDKINLDNDTFRINLPINYNPINGVASFLPNTWYRVVVHDEVKSSQGKDLEGLNYDDPNDSQTGPDSYSWTFKTKSVLCGLYRVEVIPDKLTLPEGNVRYRYFSQPWSKPDVCDNSGQRLNPYTYNWRWDDVEVTGNGAYFLTPLKDGCGNGIVEPGEDCDTGLQSVPGCDVNCLWHGTPACSSVVINNCCGNKILEAGEECEKNPDNSWSDYCGRSSCLWTGNINYDLPVCGNGIVEVDETCDLGTEPNSDESDGCTDICLKSGAVPTAGSLCGDGQIGLGEECDSGDLRENHQPASGDGDDCTGVYSDANPQNPPNHLCDSFTTKTICEQIDINNPANNHIKWCYWTGRDCRVRPCLAEDNLTTGKTNYNSPVCGNGIVEEGEECDLGNEPNYNSKDGCSDQCVYERSVAKDGRIDPYQIIETVPLGTLTALDQVKEKIQAWQVLQSNLVGIGELTVVSDAQVPFAVIGHQPPFQKYCQNITDRFVDCTNNASRCGDPAECVLVPQCRNVAIWAVFSQELNLSTLGTCQNSGEPCLTDSSCGQGDVCQFNFKVCQDDCGINHNLISGLAYQKVQGQCLNNQCQYPLADRANQNFGACQTNNDCQGSQVRVTSLAGDRAVYFDNKNDYIEITDSSSLDITGGITMAAWVKTSGNPQGNYVCLGGDNKGRLCDDGSGGGDIILCPDRSVGTSCEWKPDYMMILRKTRAYEIVIDRFGQAAILIGDGEHWIIGDLVSGTTDVTDGQWHHIVGVHSATEGWSKIYVDGHLEGSNPEPLTYKLTNINDENLFISHVTQDGHKDQRFFNGTINDVALYDQILTAEEILSLAQNYPVAQGLVSFWRFNEDERGVVKDEKETNHGTLVGNPPYIITSEGFLAANSSYQLFIQHDNNPDDDVAEGVVSVTNNPLIEVTSGSQATQWNFSTGLDFCKCDYVGVTIDPTSAGTLTEKDFFTCASDNYCGANTDSPLDNDVDNGLVGNQHQYTAQCYATVNPTNTRIPIDLGVDYSWWEIDADSIIYLTDTSGNSLPATYNDPIYITPEAKNGRAYVNVRGTAQLGPAGLQSSVFQRIEVTNFICENPWPDIPRYEDNDTNCTGSGTCHDTNFELYFCQDFGQGGFTDDLPSLPSPTVIDTVLMEKPGTNILKEFIFPVCNSQTECDSSAEFSSDALGIRVMKNPLHLSPATWYRTGLCGGMQNFENLCFSDADCATTADLVAHWGFNEGLGETTADGSGNGNDGQLINGPTWISEGKIDKALQFDGVNDQVKVYRSDSLNFGALTDFTMAAWIKAETAQLTYPVIINRRNEGATNGYIFFLWSDGRLAFQLHDGTHTNYQSTSDDLRDNIWRHVAATADRDGNLIFYVDGVPKGQFPISDKGNIDSTSNIFIGWDERNPGATYFNGSIDELRIYNRVLSAEEIKILSELKVRAGSECRLNVPIQGSPQSTIVDGYEAVKDGRTVYVGATNLDLANSRLYSNIYLMSYNQGAQPETIEIFNRILDPAQQQGVWYFNPGFTNERICQGVGYFEGTESICPNVGEASDQCEEINNGIECSNLQDKGCYWSDEINACLARICQPIYCHNDFDCPNLNCDAEKEKVVRDARRYGNLRDIQIALKNYLLNNGQYPELAGGSYIAKTTFSAWPSWQQTLSSELGGTLYIDPINRFVGCNDFYCDMDGDGRIDPSMELGEECVFGDIEACDHNPAACLPLDPDQVRTCWDELGLQFYCPADMFVYAYQSLTDNQGYNLYTNFEYEDTGNWQSGLYELPLSSVAEGETCKKLNFEIHQASVGGGVIPVTCTKKRCYGGDNNPLIHSCDDITGCNDQGPGTFCSGDADQDGICDLNDDGAGNDNCSPHSDCANPRDCYNPDQRNSDGIFGGDVCDSVCSGDVDSDGWCDEYDNCRTVFNCNTAGPVTGSPPTQACTDGGADSDTDNIGDACDPCTDIDHDSWWDMDTGANDENICPRDNCPAGITVFSDRHSYCSSDGGTTPLPIVCTVDNQASCPGGQVCCPEAGQTCHQFNTYNPLQEDYDNDQIGYICDDCIDFDEDGLGDWTFYYKDTLYCDGIGPSSKEDDYPQADEELPNCIDTGSEANCPNQCLTWTWTTLTNNEKEHFYGCQGDLSSFQDWPIPPTEPDHSSDYDLDNCPAGPYSIPCYDEFGIEVSCSNPGQEDRNLDLEGDICDPCGNDRVEPMFGEQCDGENLGGQSCVTQNLAGGDLACDSYCQFDISGCYGCGDGKVDSGEACDCGSVTPAVGCTTLNNVSCNSGYGTGQPGCDYCANNCAQLIHLDAHYCGDNNLDSADGEDCDDGNSIDGDGCNTFSANCQYVCGDGYINSAGGEACDYGVGNNSNELYQNEPVCSAVGYQATCSPANQYSGCGIGCTPETTDYCNIYLDADDEYDIWINGTRVVSHHSKNPPGGQGWEDITDYDFFDPNVPGLDVERIKVSDYFTSGDNLIAIKAYDWPAQHWNQGMMMHILCDIGSGVPRLYTKAAVPWKCIYTDQGSAGGGNTGNLDVTDPTWKSDFNYSETGWTTPIISTSNNSNRYSVKDNGYNANLIWGSSFVCDYVTNCDYWSYTYCRYKFTIP